MTNLITLLLFWTSFVGPLAKVKLHLQGLTFKSFLRSLTFSHKGARYCFKSALSFEENLWELVKVFCVVDRRHVDWKSCRSVPDCEEECFKQTLQTVGSDGVEKVYLMCSQSTVLNQGSFFTSFTPEILSGNVLGQFNDCWHAWIGRK